MRCECRPEPVTTVPRTVAEALDEHLTLEVECIDRMHVNLYRRSVHVRLAYRTPRQNDAGLTCRPRYVPLDFPTADQPASSRRVNTVGSGHRHNPRPGGITAKLIYTAITSPKRLHRTRGGPIQLGGARDTWNSANASAGDARSMIWHTNVHEPSLVHRLEDHPRRNSETMSGVSGATLPDRSAHASL